MQMDMRFPSHTGIKSAVTADVESLAWDPHDQNSFVVIIWSILVIVAFLLYSIFEILYLGINKYI